MMTTISSNNEFLKSARPGMQSSAGIKDMMKKFENSEQNLVNRNAVKCNLNKEDDKPEFLKQKLKPVSERKNENQDSVPEFLRQKLKSPSERRGEHEHTKENVSMNGTIEKPLLSKPPISSSKPAFPSKLNNLKKPGITGKGEAENVHNDSSIAKNKFLKDNLENANENVEDNIHPGTNITRDRKNSAKLRVAFFEHITKERESTVIKPNKPSRPRKPSDENDNSINENETPSNINSSKSPSRKSFSSESQNKKITCMENTNGIVEASIHAECFDSYKPPVRGEINGPTEETIYDDVTEFTPNNVITEDYYDDVNELNVTSLQNARNSSQVLPSPEDQNVVQDDFYDDVSPSGSVKRKENQGMIEDQNVVQDDFYDDVSPSGSVKRKENQGMIEDQNVVQDDFYDDVSPSGSVKRKENQGMIDDSIAPLEVPAKPDKSFSPLDKDKFIIPLGLEKWLRDVLAKNKHRLKNVVNGVPQQAPAVQRGSKPKRSSVKKEQQGEESDNDLCNDVETEIDGKTSTSTTLNSATLKRLFKRGEKNERDPEREKKEKEEKKKKKEWKKYNLDINKSLSFNGTVVSKIDFKSKNKLDLCYMIGEELNIIDTTGLKCPDGKMLVQSMEGKLGYVLKKDFGMEDKVETTVEPIPTEDDEPGTYELLGAPSPPPVPATPRPNFSQVDPISQRPAVQPPPIPSSMRPESSPVTSNASLQVDEIYDDITTPALNSSPPPQVDDVYDDIAPQSINKRPPVHPPSYPSSFPSAQLADNSKPALRVDETYDDIAPQGGQVQEIYDDVSNPNVAEDIYEVVGA